jgi:hypothetical protein
MGIFGLFVERINHNGPSCWWNRTPGPPCLWRIGAMSWGTIKLEGTGQDLLNNEEVKKAYLGG